MGFISEEEFRRRAAELQGDAQTQTQTQTQPQQLQSEADIVNVVENAVCSRERAVDALSRHNGDVVEAIMWLTNPTGNAQSSPRQHAEPVQAEPNYVELVMDQTSCTAEQALDALRRNNDDIVSAIMWLTDVNNAVTETPINQMDIRLVVEQTQCSEKQALDALRRNNGDIVNAILELTM